MRAGAYAALALLLLMAGGSRAFGAEDPPRFGLFLDSIVETGLARDAIPPIDRPDYISVENAGMILDSTDPIFVYEGREENYLFPQQIMVWHEILNLEVDGVRTTVTYSPLAGAIAAFEGAVDMYKTSFGNTGSLLNNNLVLYDRSTESMWPQIFGTAIDGPLEGVRLTMRPLLWTDWKHAKEAYPDGKVLSPDTGYRRQYGRDPYGSYHHGGTYYDNEMIVYPLTSFDERLHPKTRILGIRGNEVRLALVKDKVAALGVANVDLGLNSLVTIYDPDLDTVRVFRRKLGARSLTFVLENGEVLDQQTGSEWSTRGRAVHGRLTGEQLTPVAAMDCMWFAWAAFFPDTLVFPQLEGDTPLF